MNEDEYTVVEVTKPFQNLDWQGIRGELAGVIMASSLGTSILVACGHFLGGGLYGNVTTEAPWVLPLLLSTSVLGFVGLIKEQYSFETKQLYNKMAEFFRGKFFGPKYGYEAQLELMKSSLSLEATKLSGSKICRR